MNTKFRTRPECYSADGLPIYYSIYNEKSGRKIHMSFRLPKLRKREGEPEYGAMLYEEVHKLSSEGELSDKDIYEALQKYAPDFWRNFFRSDKSEPYLKDVLNKEEGLPLAIVWIIDGADLAEQLNWVPKTLRKKERKVELMVQQGWGAIPIGKLNTKYCGDTFLSEFSYIQQAECIALLKQLAAHEIGHGRLKRNPWPKDARWNRKVPPKQSGKHICQHIRPDHIEREMVHRIVEEMIALFNDPTKRKYALALLLCLTMGLSAEEVAYLTVADITFEGDRLPVALHVRGTAVKKGKRIESRDYPDDSPKNRVIPIPSRLAQAMKPMLEEWKVHSKNEEEFKKRHLVPNTKHPQRKTDPKEIEQWINDRLRSQLTDKRMHDGTGRVIRTRSPYQRCLATPKLSLVHCGFEEDEWRYFFGRKANSTAGKFYCDFVNKCEQMRMRGIQDQWLGSPEHDDLFGDVRIKNPPAGHEMAFGAQGKIAHVDVDLEFPAVPEELLTNEGYSLQIYARRGFSLNAVVVRS